MLELVSREGAAKKSAARFWALGVNGVGVALMVLVFSQTGGLIGAEVGVAGGTAVLAQRVLEAIFGEDAVRRLAKQAKGDLDARVEAVMATELGRYLAALDAVGFAPEQAGEVRAALAEVNEARIADARLTASERAGLPASGVSGVGELGRGSTPALTAGVDAEAVTGEVLQPEDER